MALNMKIGMDMVDNSQIKPEFLSAMKFFMPVMTLVATSQFPSALCLYWFISNIISILQGAILRMPAVNNFFGIGEMKKWSDADLPMKNISISKQLSGTIPSNEMPHTRNNAQNFDKMGIKEALRKAELKDH